MSTYHKSFSKQILLTAYFFCLSLFSTVVAKAQERVIELHPLDHHPQIAEIVEIKVKGQAVVLGEPFVADDDWMSGMTVKVKNISDKPVVYIRVGLGIPLPNQQANFPGHGLEYGQEPNQDGTSSSLKLINPGESIELIFQENRYNELREWINKRSSITNINKAVVRISVVIFEDDTLWTNGFFFRHSDRNEPRKWVQVSQ